MNLVFMSVIQFFGNLAKIDVQCEMDSNVRYDTFFAGKICREINGKCELIQSVSLCSLTN